MWNDNDRIMEIFNKANEGGSQLPCECPVCHNRSAHIYIHRHNDQHCGIWTWCNECGASSHMSGETPAWWVNPDFVDESQLCSDPSYLDGLADTIDKWVNSLMPTENANAISPFVMEDKFEVVLRDNLQGLPAGATGTMVIRNDFKTMTIDFIGADRKKVRIHETPERLLQIVEVVKPTNKRSVSKTSKP